MIALLALSACLPAVPEDRTGAAVEPLPAPEGGGDLRLARRIVDACDDILDSVFKALGDGEITPAEATRIRKDGTAALRELVDTVHVADVLAEIREVVLYVRHLLEREPAKLRVRAEDHKEKADDPTIGSAARSRHLRRYLGLLERAEERERKAAA